MPVLHSIIGWSERRICATLIAAITEKRIKAKLQVNSDASSKEESPNATVAGKSNPPSKPKNGDSWRFLLVELLNQLGLFFSHASQSKGVQATALFFDQVVRLLDSIDKMPEHDGCLIIRRIIPPTADATAKPDYFILFGDQAFSQADLVQHHSANSLKSTHLTLALDHAFTCFNALGISALFLQLPGKSSEKIDQLRLSLNILARFRKAVENNASITFRYLKGARTIPLGRDSNGKPDPNLTLVAGLNGLSAANMRELVKQADALCTLTTPDTAPCRSSDSYNQIFNTRSLRSQLIRPLVEINNLPWMQRQEAARSKTVADDAAHSVISLDETLSPEDLAGEIRQYLAGFLEARDQTAAELLNALFEYDFAALDAPGTAKTLNALTRLLRAVEKHTRDTGPVDRLLFYLHDRLGQISEEVLSQLSVQRQGLKVAHQGKSLLVGMIHPRLIGILNLVKERITVQHKLAAVREYALDLNVPDPQFWALHFKLSARAAADLQGLLARGLAAGIALDPIRFNDRLDRMDQEQEAGRLFEIMWCLLRGNATLLERSALLDGLVLLGGRLKHANDTLGFLLSDVFQNHDPVDPADRNAFALATLMLRTHRKEQRVDLEHTPEDVLAIKKSLHAGLVQYASWRMDIDPFRVLSKFNAIRSTLGRGLREKSGQTAVTDPVFRSLLGLEREGLIFASLTGGKTARLVLRGALDYYGDPCADIYLGHPHVTYLIDLMGHLRVVLRGMARLGQARDLDTLKAMEQNAAHLMALNTDSTYARRAQQMLQWVAPAIRAIQVQAQ
jgi:hypothetical protein